METLSFEVRDSVGWIRLARPHKRNPFDSLLRRDLMTVLDRVRDDPAVRVLVLAGSPGAFCAGGNLKDLEANIDAGPAYWQQRINSGLRLVNDLLRLTRPLIAVVDGPAYGAGFSLALTADLVIASPRARFSMAYLRLGLVPDLGPLYLLPRIVGLQRAKELMFSTREVDADEARSLGIVMEIHESAVLEARAQQIALSMARASPTALALTKSALNASLDSDQSTMFTLEANSQAAAFSTAEPKAAIAAMLARQAPAYAGFPPRTEGGA
ncbi:enoyl-CoA hydratase/isomerase family protein [Piscinibacter sakaiensis]|uniref:Enoyl-CoA hydratase n=1 Tax=Piscinibacter sakaiensis TaxID=1547922 RepID=A0A0K8P7C7_PISS1|nr:enoyl-CoA hydratase/isomerase family protein [Piscinibacter sakaiensis]GAP38105.1 enoyl-CoA hydratase [Piscinibacter sakaiensis]